MQPTRHGAGPKAVGERARPPQKKTTLHAKRRGPHRRNHQGHRRFLRHSAIGVFHTIAQVIRTAPPLFRTRPWSTPGRLPTPSRDVGRFLLQVLQGWSYDETDAMLETLPDLARVLRFEKGVPAASTAAGLADRTPLPWLEGVIQQITVRLSRGRRVNVVDDSTGEATYKYHRWFDAQ